jgi:hypothetical protein
MTTTNAMLNLMNAVESPSLHSRAAAAFAGFMLLSMFNLCLIGCIGSSLELDLLEAGAAKPAKPMSSSEGA